MLRQIRDALLGDDDVGLGRDDLRAQVLDVLFLDPQQLVPVLLLLDLDVGVRFASFVFERAVEEQNARLDDAPAHAWVRHVLVERDAAQNARLRRLAAGDFLDFGVPLDVDFFDDGGRERLRRCVATGGTRVHRRRRRRRLRRRRRRRCRRGGGGLDVAGDAERRLDGHVDDQVAEPRREFRAQTRVHEILHAARVGKIHRPRDALALREHRLQGDGVALAEDGGVQIGPLQERRRLPEEFSGEHDD
mmetsp:Transcript_27198/g.108901  ORF Transcript_27198/g.108901 Transcript_27198/m.108901 type:complete len:247 (+) Transcript_27198:2435-3175(+)